MKKNLTLILLEEFIFHIVSNEVILAIKLSRYLKLMKIIRIGLSYFNQSLFDNFINEYN